jgi:predicted chitinase
MLAESDLQRIMPRLPADKRQLYLPFLNRVMEIDEIDTPPRMAAFLAQLAHESGEFRFMEEIWGPTAAQRRYEPPSDLARKLGNTQPGDGKRFKGRGPIQITGRFNYKKYGDLLGVDLISNPDLAATPQIAFQTAGLYWRSNGLNELADRQDFITITRRINGGLNGLADRQKYYDIARNVLGVGSSSTVASSRSAAPGAGSSRGASTARSLDAAPAGLQRGYEAIQEDQEAINDSRPSDEPKKKSAGASARSIKKPVSKKSVKPAAKKAAAKPAKKAAKKQTVKSASKKTAKKTAKKVARPAAKKTAKKPSRKSR